MASLVTDLGLANITAAWHAYASRMKFLQWGEGSGQTATDTAIDDAGNTSENRTDGTTSVQTTTTTGDTFQISGTITALEALAVTEVGVFDAAGTGNPPTGGNMGIYGDFSAINLSTNDSIAFTIKVVFDQA
jgi:hypothetical protein